MCPERSLTDTHAPRGSLPPPLHLAPCPSRTCAKVICCDHLEQSISSAQHSSLAVAQLNFVSSLWGSTWITCGSLLFSLLSSILLFSFFRSPALAWLGLINSAALKYDAHSVSPPPSPARPVPAPATVLLLQLPSPARQAGRHPTGWSLQHCEHKSQLDTENFYSCSSWTWSTLVMSWQQATLNPVLDAAADQRERGRAASFPSPHLRDFM